MGCDTSQQIITNDKEHPNKLNDKSHARLSKKNREAIKNNN